VLEYLRVAEATVQAPGTAVPGAWSADRAAGPSITIYLPDSASHTTGTQVITREH
jgi:hypothetical protein